MTSSEAPLFPSIKETTNYARLCRLLVDVGCQVLRETFDAVHSPEGLHLVLGRHPEHAILQSLGRRRILRSAQWAKLYPTVPSSVSSANFDFFLLFVLLKNICGLTPPATGWNILPPATDVSVEANIVRLRYYRNVVYSHASQASVDDATFNSYWQDISDAIVGLGGASYGSAINRLKNECMDPLTEVKMKEKIQDIQDRVTDEIHQTRSQVEKLNYEFEIFLSQHEETRRRENIRSGFEQLRAEIGELSEYLASLKRQQDDDTKDEDVIPPYVLARGRLAVEPYQRVLQRLKTFWKRIEIHFIGDLTQEAETENKITVDLHQMRSQVQNLRDNLEPLVFQQGDRKSQENIRSMFEQLRATVRKLRDNLASLKTQQADKEDEVSVPRTLTIKLMEKERKEEKSLEVEDVPCRSTDQDNAGKMNEQKTVIRRGKIANERETWNLAEAGASITFNLGTITKALTVTCSLWRRGALSPPIGTNKLLVSNVIELSHDGPPDLEFMENAPGRVNLALWHSASNLKGYEAVIKQFVDAENNEWKDLETTNIWQTSGNPTVPDWMFPFAEATCSKTWFSSFAVIWRLKSFFFPKLKSVTPEFICSVPDYPSVSVTIPRNSLPTDTDFCFTLKVQEAPSIDRYEEGMFAGPILHISCSHDVKLSEPAKISVPLVLTEGEREPVERHSGQLRILHFKSREKSHEWTDITDHLEMPVVFKDGIVTFQVKAFSRYWPCLLLTSSVPWKYVRFLYSRVMKLRAGFLACLCEDAVPSRNSLILSCFPQHLSYEVKKDISTTYHVIMQGYGTSLKSLSNEDETFVSLSNGFQVHEEGSTEDIILTFLHQEPFRLTVRVSFGDRSSLQVNFLKWRGGKERKEPVLICPVPIIQNKQTNEAETRKFNSEQPKTNPVPHPTTSGFEEGNGSATVNGVRNDVQDSSGNPPHLSFKLPDLKDLPTSDSCGSDFELPVDILLLTVEDCEFLACFHYLNQPSRRYHKSTGYVYYGSMGHDLENKLKTALVKCSRGSSVPDGSLIVVNAVIRALGPKAVFSVGTCIGLTPKETRLGDVVLSSKLTTFAYKTPVSRDIGNIIKHAADGWRAPLKDPQARKVNIKCDGTVLSIPLSQASSKNIIHKYSEATAVEVEGEGVFAAAHHLKTEWVVVKGIKCYASQNQSSSYEWDVFASVMAASVVSNILRDPGVFQDWSHYNEAQPLHLKLEEEKTNTRWNVHIMVTGAVVLLSVFIAVLLHRGWIGS